MYIQPVHHLISKFIVFHSFLESSFSTEQFCMFLLSTALGTWLCQWHLFLPLVLVRFLVLWLVCSSLLWVQEVSSHVCQHLVEISSHLISQNCFKVFSLCFILRLMLEACCLCWLHLYWEVCAPVLVTYCTMKIWTYLNITLPPECSQTSLWPVCISIKKWLSGSYWKISLVIDWLGLNFYFGSKFLNCLKIQK